MCLLNCQLCIFIFEQPECAFSLFVTRVLLRTIFLLHLHNHRFNACRYMQIRCRLRRSWQIATSHHMQVYNKVATYREPNGRHVLMYILSITSCLDYVDRGPCARHKECFHVFGHNIKIQRDSRSCRNMYICCKIFDVLHFLTFWYTR